MITLAFTHFMNLPDSYEDLELDSAVLHELALIEATLLAASLSGPVDQSPSNPDADHVPSKTPNFESPFTAPFITHFMNSLDSYEDLELDSAVLHELALIEATLLAASPSGLVDQSPSNPDADHPDADHDLPREIASYPREVQYQGQRYLYLHPSPQVHDSTQLTTNWTIEAWGSPIVNRGLGKGKRECWMREGMKSVQ
ncbi:hypothetical protein V8E53_014375 [Lactarius tabidus]